MKALTAGFDATSSHLILLVFSIVLDAFLWLGPRLHLNDVMNLVFEELQAFSNPQTPDFLPQLQSISHDLNMFSILRTYPVGIPSLIAPRLSYSNPIGISTGLEIPSAFMILVLWVLLTLVGLVAGTLFFNLVAQSAVNGNINWKTAFNQLPKASFQVCILTVICFFLLLAAFMPFSCLIAVLFASSGIGQLGYLALLIFAGFIIWLLAPLIFSPHGIILNQLNALTSIVRGFYFTRLTLPSTSLLILTFLLLSEGLDVLWNIPESSSWLVLLGIIGHAFVTTSLLAASFIYYHDIDRWVGEIVKRVEFSSA